MYKITYSGKYFLVEDKGELDNGIEVYTQLMKFDDIGELKDFLIEMNRLYKEIICNEEKK